MTFPLNIGRKTNSNQSSTTYCKSQISKTRSLRLMAKTSSPKVSHNNPVPWPPSAHRSRNAEQSLICYSNPPEPKLGMKKTCRRPHASLQTSQVWQPSIPITTELVRHHLSNFPTKSLRITKLIRIMKVLTPRNN